MLEKHPTWTIQEAAPVAKAQFEASTRALWLETLALAKALRPHGTRAMPPSFVRLLCNSLNNRARLQ